MVRDFEQLLDRREFISKIMRYLISGGLGISTGALILKRIRAKDDERCTNYFTCQNCAKLFDCDLPSALNVKENLEGDKYVQ